MTTPLRLQPYTNVAYICGLDSNNILRHHIEQQWQLSTHILKSKGVTDVKQIARSASDVIDQNNTLIDAISPIQLKLILLFRK